MKVIKSLAYMKTDRSKGIYIFLGFMFVFMMGFAAYSFSAEGTAPMEMKVYFGVHLALFLYIIKYVKDSDRTDTFLGKKDNGVVIWDILKYALQNTFSPIKSLINKRKKN